MPSPTLIDGEIPPVQTGCPDPVGQRRVLHLKCRSRLTHIMQSTQKSEQRPPSTPATVIKKTLYGGRKKVIPDKLRNSRGIKQMPEQ